MSMEKNTAYRLLGMAAADILKLYNCKFALIDTDGMGAALIDVTDKGDCAAKVLYQGSEKPDFYQTVSDVFPKHGKDEVFELCKNSKKSLVRYLKTEGSSDEQLNDGICCSNLVQIFDRDYKGSIEQVINEVRENAPESTNIVLAGRLAAFYPAEHTVKKAITPMPFLPVDNFYVSDLLCVDSQELIQKGKAVAEALEKDKKSVCHNVMLQLKRLSGDGPVDWLMLLAKKGDSFDSLKNSKYSDEVIVHALDPIVVFSDSTQYTLKLPRKIFTRGNVTAKVQFAIDIDNEVPKLAIKNGDKITMLDIDTKIYSEV